jgi:hypothetical protein
MQKVELLAPKDHCSHLNVAFEEIVDVGTKKVNIFPWLSSN